LKYIFRWENSLASEEIPESFIIKYGITAREQEIVALIKKGKTTKQIARELYIAAMTVKNHIHNIYQKTSAEGKIELIYMASKEKVSRTILEKIFS
jgi:DNA-binding NarL/FixJ family response regulator